MRDNLLVATCDVHKGNAMTTINLAGKASQYHHIAAWGEYLRSFRYFIAQEQDRAALDNAPIDAISFSLSSNRWTMVSEIADEYLRVYIDNRAIEIAQTA